MPYYVIDSEAEITVIELLEKPTYEQVKQMLDDIVANYNYENRVYDFSKINFNFSLDEIKMISKYGKQVFIRPNNIAIVAPDDLAYGEMRQFEVYRKQEKHSNVRVFRCKDESIEWLKKNHI